MIITSRQIELESRNWPKIVAFEKFFLTVINFDILMSFAWDIDNRSRNSKRVVFAKNSPKAVTRKNQIKKGSWKDLEMKEFGQNYLLTDRNWSKTHGQSKTHLPVCWQAGGSFLVIWGLYGPMLGYFEVLHPYRTFLWD